MHLPPVRVPLLAALAHLATHLVQSAQTFAVVPGMLDSRPVPIGPRLIPVLLKPAANARQRQCTLTLGELGCDVSCRARGGSDAQAALQLHNSPLQQGLQQRRCLHKRQPAQRPPTGSILTTAHRPLDLHPRSRTLPGAGRGARRAVSTGSACAEAEAAPRQRRWRCNNTRARRALPDRPFPVAGGPSRRAAWRGFSMQPGSGSARDRARLSGRRDMTAQGASSAGGSRGRTWPPAVETSSRACTTPISHLSSHARSGL
eukprot:365428-Chlamydomonas_euryale.AAC.18